MSLSLFPLPFSSFQIQVRHIHVPMLMRGQRLHETRATRTVLECIYEQDFLGFSYELADEFSCAAKIVWNP